MENNNEFKWSEETVKELLSFLHKNPPLTDLIAGSVSFEDKSLAYKDLILKEFKKSKEPASGFIEGKWLIRKWDQWCGAEYDLARFKERVNEKSFKFSKFYRIKNKKVWNLMDGEFNTGDNTVDYKDLRMEFNFRVATKKEVRMFAKIIIESE